MYGNGIEINLGNETGGIRVNSNADLYYTELWNVSKTGVFTPYNQMSYLYFFFPFPSIELISLVVFRFLDRIVLLRVALFFIVFVFFINLIFLLRIFKTPRF